MSYDPVGNDPVDFLFLAYKSIIISEVTAAVVKPYYLWGGWVFLEGEGCAPYY